MPTLSTTPAPAAAYEAESGSARPGSKATIESALKPDIPLAKWGIASLRPHFLYQLLYATDLLNPQQLESATSYLQTYSPGTVVEVGNHWVFDYTFSRVLYSNRFFSTESRHNAAITGTYSFDGWSVATSAHYSTGTSTQIETARQTPQRTYQIEFNIDKRIGKHAELITHVEALSRHIGQMALTPEWAASDWDSRILSETIEYHFTSLDVGAELSAGYDRVTPGPDMKHTEPSAHFTWHPTEKISLHAKAGVETRSFSGGRNDRIQTPLYELLGEYAPLPTIKLTVGADRTYSASYFANWATRSETWRVGLDHRVMRHYYLHVGLSNGYTTYVDTTIGSGFKRVDRGQIVTARLSTPFIGHGNISIFYQNGRNLANAPGFSYRGHEAGTELSYRF